MSDGPILLTRSAIDQLGERLRVAVTESDIKLLDQYRRGFRKDYDHVLEVLHNKLSIQATGRPAKSTNAIVDKLKRGSMRLSQMQDIAGCRLTTDDISSQDHIVSRITQSFSSATVIDRRTKPSHGYRAVHIIVRPNLSPIEIQVRTYLQHLWAEMSERFSDTYGSDVKYGGGPDNIRRLLQAMSIVVELELKHAQATSQRKIDESARDFHDAWLRLLDIFKG